MGHGFTQTDSAVFAGKPAWHGLGRVVETAPTPAEALTLANLGWSVLESAGVAGPVELPGEPEPVRFTTDTHKLLVRSDTREVLGVVGAGYQPVQNADLADLACTLAGESGEAVRVESAASIKGGRRVWFLLRGEPYALNRGKDEVIPYLLLANGHDGTQALIVTPTPVRVVCKNTLGAALSGITRASLCWIKHSGSMDQKINQARRVIEAYRKAEDKGRENAERLDARTMTRTEIQEFWIDIYQRVELEGAIPTSPTSAEERKTRQEAIETIAAWSRRFDMEVQTGTASPSAWTAANAVTWWYDHERTVRGKDNRARNEARLFGKLFGQSAESKARVITAALALA